MSAYARRVARVSPVGVFSEGKARILSLVEILSRLAHRGDLPYTRVDSQLADIVGRGVISPSTGIAAQQALEVAYDAEMPAMLREEGEITPNAAMNYANSLERIFLSVMREAVQHFMDPAE